MKKILIITCIAIIGFLPTTLKSQTKQYYSIDWSIGIPIGSSSDFISAVSPAGFNFGGQIYMTDNVALDFGVGWNNFYELKDRETYTKGGFAITAAQYRYISYIPFKAGGMYNFMPSSKIQPYAGLNIGFNYMTENVFIQENLIWTDQYGFIISPEIGAFLSFDEESSMGLHVSAAYTYNTNEFSFMKNYKGFQNITFNVGLTFMLGR